MARLGRRGGAWNTRGSSPGRGRLAGWPPLLKPFLDAHRLGLICGHTKIGVVPSRGARLVGIEGFRALAATSVLVYHAWLYSSPTGAGAAAGPLRHVLPDFAYGVTLFFTLSGFLLFRPFAAAIIRGEPLPKFGSYLRNRALRIFPAYWVILLLAALVFQSVLIRDLNGALRNGGLFEVRRLIPDMLLIQHYDPDTVVTGIGPAWSLAVELVFYVALPLLVLLAAKLARRASGRRGRQLATLAPVALLLAVGLGGKAAAAYVVSPIHPFDGWEADWHSVLERSFLCQADLFAFGMALAIVRTESEDGLLRLPRRWRVGTAALALLCYLVTAKFTHFVEQMSYSPFNTLIALGCALLLALVVLPARRPHRAGLFVRFLETRPVIAVGLTSYSIFLWHEPLIRWMAGHDLTAAGKGGLALNVLMLGAFTGALSALTYRFVEVPALRLKSRRSSPRFEPRPSPPAGEGSPTPAP